MEDHATAPQLADEVTTPAGTDAPDRDEASARTATPHTVSRAPSGGATSRRQRPDRAAAVARAHRNGGTAVHTGTRPARAPHPLPTRGYLLMPFIGAATAATVTSMVGLVPRAIGDGRAHAVASALAAVITLIAPLSGIPVARRIAGGRYEARLDAVAIAMICVSGLVATVAAVMLA